MARDWRDLFIVDGAATTAPEAEPVAEQRRGGMFRRLRENLRKTRQALTSEIQATLFEDLSDETWERLEEALIYADVGASTTAQVVEKLEHEATAGELSGGEALTQRLTELLADIARTGDDRIDLLAKPTVILVAGVNGTGKTTTVGKLAWHLSNSSSCGRSARAWNSSRARRGRIPEQSPTTRSRPPGATTPTW
jgi:fused signal recognition particle receptor